MATPPDPSAAAPPTPPEVKDFLDRLSDHWFAPTAHAWHWSRRFIFTLTGSLTFFFFWFLYVAPYGLASETYDSTDFLFFLLVFAIPGSLWFAGIAAWKDLGYGPVRLYLTGFLLPYFVWNLILFMLGRTRPELGI